MSYSSKSVSNEHGEKIKTQSNANEPNSIPTSPKLDQSASIQSNCYCFNTLYQLKNIQKEIEIIKSYKNYLSDGICVIL